MRIIDKKPRETPENIFYGVDVNDKAAVEREFLRLRKIHRNVTIVAVIALLILAVFVFDFCRVNFFDAKPILAIEEKVDKGTLFSGLGYKVLYCNNGEKHIGSVQFKTCTEPEPVEFSNFVYKQLVDYAVKEEILVESNLESFVINSVVADEFNEEGGSDYLTNISYVCKDGSVTCFKTKKEYYDINDVTLYVRINKYNEVYDIIPFKGSGDYYEIIVADYTEKLKTYLIENELLDEENLRNFKLTLADNYGKYNFRNTTYADSYLIQIDYMCVDNSNTCIKAIDNKDNEGDYANLSFYASMFVDQDENILLVGPREYLDL